MRKGRVTFRQWGEEYLRKRGLRARDADVRCKCDDEISSDLGNRMTPLDLTPDYFRLRCPKCMREVTLRLNTLNPTPFWLARFAKWLRKSGNLRG